MYLDDNTIVIAEKFRHDMGPKGKSLQRAFVNAVTTQQGMSVV